MLGGMESKALELGSGTTQPAYSKVAVLRHAFLLSIVTFAPSFVVAILFVLMLAPEAGNSVAPEVASQPELVRLFAERVVVLPLLETVLFQFLVIELLLRIGLRKPIHIVAIAAVLFIGAHLSNESGVLSAISVIPGGIVLAYCYLHWRRKTALRRVAFSATSLAHALHNLYFWALNFVPASVMFG